MNGDERHVRQNESKRTITAEDIYRAKSSTAPVTDNTTVTDDPLQSQTPLKRRIKQKNDTSSEPGTTRRRTQIKRYKVKESSNISSEKQVNSKVKKKKSKLWGRLIIVACMYAIMMPIALLLIYVWLPHSAVAKTGNFTYRIGTVNDLFDTHVSSFDIVCDDNVFYADMTDIADFCAMTTTGDDNIRRYVTRSNNEYVLFRIGQRSVIVNGVESQMDAPCKLIDGRLYVPVSFINRCMIGLKSEVNEESKTISVVRLNDNMGVPVEIEFLYKPNKTVEIINFDSLDRDLQITIMRRTDPMFDPDNDDTENQGDIDNIIEP